MWIGWPASPRLDEYVAKLEGIDQVMDNLSKRDFKGIIIGPWTAVETPEGEFQYGPFDSEKRYRESLRQKVGSKTRKMKFYHAFDPTPKYYESTELKPLELDPTFKHKGKENIAKKYFQEILNAADDRGLETYYLLIAVCPMRDYAPKGMLETTDVFGKKMGFACLNTPGLPEYLEGVLRDVLETYPSLGGIVLDHLEFPSYTSAETFCCFCDGCRAKAESYGYSLNEIKQSVLRFHSWIRDEKNIKQVSEYGVTSMDVIAKIFSDEGLSDWFKFKFKSANDFATRLQGIVNQLNPSLEFQIDTVAPSFCPISGTDVVGLSKYCTMTNPKLYPTAGYWGWHTRLPDYVNFVMTSNKIDEATAIKYIVNLFGLKGLSKYNNIKDLQNKPFPVEFFRSETEKAAKWFGDKQRVRPWVWIDCETIDEIRNIVRGIAEAGVEGAFFKQYSAATEQKLDIIQEEFSK
jgi:hypothetical protein